MVATSDVLRVKASEAARRLGLNPQYLYALVRDGVFTPIRPSGKGPGKKLYLLPAEVEAFATGGKDAVAKLRENPTASK